MLNEQAWLTLFVGTLAAVPGLVAFWLLWRRGAAAPAATLAVQVSVQKQIQEQLQQQITAQQQTIRFLTRRVDELEKAREREYIETEALRQENEGLRNEMAELRRGVAELLRQMEAAKLTPAWTMPAAIKGRSVKPESDPAAVRKKIATLFSLDEINELAYDLHVKPDELSGSTGTTRARSLVEFMKDRGRLEELIKMCRSLRPEGDF